MNLHFRAGDLVEKIGCSPLVHKFAAAIDVRPCLRGNEIDMFGIIPAQLTGDFRIGAHGVSAKHFTVLMDGALDILQDSFGRQIRGQTGIHNQLSRAGRKAGGLRLNLRRGGKRIRGYRARA